MSSQQPQIPAAIKKEIETLLGELDKQIRNEYKKYPDALSPEAHFPQYDINDILQSILQGKKITSGELTKLQQSQFAAVKNFAKVNAEFLQKHTYNAEEKKQALARH